MRRNLAVAFIMFLFLSFLGVPGAGAAEWTFDPPHSNVYFDIHHIFATVRGNFRDFSGTFTFDPDNLAASGMDIAVQTKSIDTQIEKRDEHVRSAEFLDVAEHPVMTFKSASIKHLKGDKYQVVGDLTIRDVTKRVAIPFTFHGIKDSPFDKAKQVAGFDAHFVIDRLAYHVGDGKYYKMGVLGKDVNVFISLEMLRDKKE